MSDAASHGSIPPPKADGSPTVGDEPSAAGASARGEHARRQERRRQRDQERYGSTIGRVASALGTPQRETAWKHGAEGEERVANYLAECCGDAAILLHDRRIPGSRANIDHIAIAASGVWVIDSKRLRARIAVQRPLFGKPKLLVGGRDKSSLLDGVLRQAECVKAAMGADATVEVHPALCFIDAELPLTGLGTARGVRLLGRRGAAAKLKARGPLGPQARTALAEVLDAALPARHN